MVYPTKCWLSVVTSLTNIGFAIPICTFVVYLLVCQTRLEIDGKFTKHTMGLYVEPVDRIQNSAVVLMTRLLQPVLTIISVLLMRLMMSHPVSSPSSDVVVMTSLQLQVSHSGVSEEKTRTFNLCQLTFPICSWPLPSICSICLFYLHTLKTYTSFRCFRQYWVKICRVSIISPMRNRSVKSELSQRRRDIFQ